MDFVQDNAHEPIPEETFTHSHLSWSPIIAYLFPPSFTIHSILLVQFMCVTVFFHNLSPSFRWSTSWPGTLHCILHTFLHQSLSSFCSTCSYHRNLFCCSTEIMSSNPSLSLNPLLGALPWSLMSHIHLTILIFAAEEPPHYTSTHGSGRRYYILPLKFLSFFFFRRRISEMALPTGNLSSSHGRI